MGRVLRPLSLFHAQLLEEALGDDFNFLDDLGDFALLEVATKICSEEKPSFDIGIPETETELVKFQDKCSKMDVEKESARFGDYVRACYLSGPRLVEVKSSGGFKRLNAPYSHIVISQILRKTSAVTFDDLLYRWPAAQVLWLYWSIRELEDDVSHIAETDEPVILAPEEQEKENRILTLVGLATAERNKKADGIVDPDVLRKIDDELAALIKRIEAGEVTEVVT